MHDVLNQFKRNEVWELLLMPSKTNIIGTKWVFKNMLDEHGLITRNKSRLVAKGYNQQEHIDFGETYAPIARLEVVRLLLAFDCIMDFKLYQMDVKSAFLKEYIEEEVYVSQSPSFEDHKNPTHGYKLKKLSMDLNKHQDNGMGDSPTFSLIKKLKKNKLIRSFSLRYPPMTYCLCRFI